MDLKLTIATMGESDLVPMGNLQSENQLGNLQPGRGKDGYLSIAFSDDDFRAFNRDIGVMVAKLGDQVVGYSCYSSARLNAPFPILDQIVANLSSYAIPGEADRPTEATTCIHGPVCIATPFRGQDVLTRLFSHGTGLAKEAGYSFCFCFVASDNQRSLKAHEKLPFQQVGKVSGRSREYIVLACRI